MILRDIFRTNVFKRDLNKCVVCGEVAVDAHHIIERRLFSDGGYYINNGVSLCSVHHLLAETTDISTIELREKANISELVLPNGYKNIGEYDKWGNLLKDGVYYRGELFHSEQVQKIMSNKLYLFSNYYIPMIRELYNDYFVVYNDAVYNDELNILDVTFDYQPLLESDMRVEYINGVPQYVYIHDKRLSDSERDDFLNILL